MADPVPLTGEPLALDLINTRPRGGPGGATVDLLAGPAQLAAWLELEHGIGDGRVLPPPPSGGAAQAVAAAGLAAVHRVRDHAEQALRALLRGAEPPASALRGLNEAQRAAPAVRHLGWDGTRVTAEPRRAGEPPARLAAVLAEAVADLLTDPAVARVRECEAEGCVMLFLPAHPRRRWCSAARCGNRARVARYYRRHRTEP
ncbi:ABATE domain-containing protein [Streptomyces sp. YIM 98790]|uniref:CGNR zinc finger domain-containing protein n=1 Tax=Streptomyces sp. YIM 98790 TaxID=2689077 RepID=UPI00140A3956|nr:ABATE domain-containing protein [Streptomyces sp. YIM 98790]